jgi:hypothetical protein
VGGAGHAGAVVFASGSRDGHINLFDQRVNTTRYSPTAHMSVRAL